MHTVNAFYAITVKMKITNIFLLNCPVLSSVRDEYFNIVSKQSSDYYIGVDFMEQSPSAKLLFIVGDIGYAFNNDIGIFYDFIGKMYIETCQAPFS